jgi:hypothetical protein
MSGMVYVPPVAPPTIKSIQRGVVTTGSPGVAQAVTISAVNVSKSFVSLGGFAGCMTSSGGAQGNIFGGRVRLTSGTTLEVLGYYYNGGSGNLNWEVIEFN